ncbi:hypothetical protein H2200_002059 [Cladophialophora chaetospira]|uniref:Uncharacterized protein n=1 Tax=Cladophialophora chaetospira TaxID=386627 RepID=A0AA38XIV5_9EURO|nr:hypothetical protein H2200_002059 [Cladophialophora chaetospira]
MSVSNNVAVVALLVSLVALIISLAQLLQQIFGTAVGYRQCNPSVIGPWSKTRRRVFHLWELRLETLFQTPEFTLTSNIASSSSEKLGDKKPDLPQRRPFFRETKQEELIVVDGTSTSMQLTLASNQGRNDDSGRAGPGSQPQAVGWLSFLQQIHNHEALYRFLQPNSAPPLASHPGKPQHAFQLPAIKKIQRSWDFMPTDALRPLASAHLGDLLILTYRMFLGWYDLQLGKRSLRAEGHGHSLTQIEIRGLGIVLEYRFAASGMSKPADRPFSGHFVPSQEADMMAFGLIPVSKEMGMSQEYFDLGKEDYNLGLLDMLGALHVDGALLDEFRSQLRKPLDEFFDVANETLPMVAPFIPLEGLGAVRVIPPFSPKRAQSLIRWREGRLVLLHRLRSHIETDPDRVTPQTKHVYDVLQTLNTDRSWGRRFARPRDYGYDPVLGLNADNDAKCELLQYLRDEFSNANQFLRNHLPEGSYADLVALHLAMAFRAQRKAKDTKAEQRRVGTPDAVGGVISWMTESAHLYVDNLESICQDMQKRCADNLKSAEVPLIPALPIIADAWWSMMLRAILWQLSVIFEDLPGLPYRSNLYGDTTQIWIS